MRKRKVTLNNLVVMAVSETLYSIVNLTMMPPTRGGFLMIRFILIFPPYQRMYRNHYMVISPLFTGEG